MRIGIDLDNTIICYDALFHQLAVERGLIDASVAPTKTAVRDALRALGMEEEWTELQGLAYGPMLDRAKPFEGVIEFCQYAQVSPADFVTLRIISHKTRYPFVGERYDLHEAARAWLSKHGLGDIVTYLEPTVEAKYARIASERCTHFIDDLPEFLGAAGFPRSVQRLLYDPHNVYGEVSLQGRGNWDRRFVSFDVIHELLEMPTP